MDLGLSGRRAVVTGASRGIGLAVAIGLAVEGVDVALVSRGGTDLDPAVERAGAGPGRGLTLAVAADRAVAPQMAAQDRGRIVNVSALNARQAASLVGSVRKSQASPSPATPWRWAAVRAGRSTTELGEVRLPVSSPDGLAALRPEAVIPARRGAVEIEV